MPDSRRSFVRKLGIGGASAAALFTDFRSGLQKAVTDQPLRSAPSDLKIIKVSAAFCTESQRKMFLKIETNQGITGYGEGVDAVVGGYYLALELGRQIVGKNPLDVNRLFDELRRTNKDNVFTGSQAGTTIAILSAIDIALWDLTGKALGLPVYRLLGGKYRDSVHLYTHPLNNSGSPENIAASCFEAKKAGYDAVKFWVDFASFEFDPDQLDSFNTNPTNKQVERIISTVAAVRAAVGPLMGIMVEMHTKFDLPSAIKLVKAFEPYNPTWIEEPVPAENMDSLREVTQSTSIPVCVGENLYLANQFETLLQMKAADIIMPDVQKCGGIGEAQRIANIANVHYVPFAPHMVGSPYALMASAHVCASVPNFLMLESNQRTISGWNGILVEPPVIEKGFLKITDKPGIGLDLIEDGIRKYASPGIPFFV